ncbi:TniQ family protein [Stenotrophomonas pavanii]|uniref:TniQ family protein n=1 Tax=Stenotrophomonas pavanii TaxID=487698 RepID=UPI0039C62D89
MHTNWSPPVPGELLTSYLARQAISHGVSPHTLVQLVSPGMPVWNRDVDVSASSLLVDSLAAESGLSPEVIEELTLSRWEQVTRRQLPPIHGVYHWLGSVGVYHRRRLRPGLAFCPACLAEGGGFLRQWRLSFWTVCPIHNRLMLDRCPRCGAPAQPQRQGFDVVICWSCSANLALPRAREAEVTRIQTLLFNALVGPCCWFLACKFRCSGKDLLWGVDALLSGFRANRLPDPSSDAQCARLEFRSIECRHADMQLVDALISDVRVLEASAQRNHITQRCFRKEMPPWLEAAVSQLPAGRTNRGCPGGRQEIRKVGDAERERRTGWREMRAALLFKMIGNGQ